MPLINQPKLSYLQRAQLYLQLATLNRAGIAAAESWRMIELGKPWRTKITQLVRALERGFDVAGAAERAGIFLPLDAALIRATQVQGDLTPAYQRLAEYYQQRAQQWQKIRAKMLVPLLMLTLALLIRPLPALILGQLSVFTYLLQVLLPPAMLAGIILSARLVLQNFQASQVGSSRQWQDQLLLNLPIFGGMHQRRCLADFWHTLAMLLAAGLPMFEAYRQAVTLVNNYQLQVNLLPVAVALEQGQTFATAISQSPLFRQQAQVCGLIRSGEASGSLPDMLSRLAAAEDQALALAQQQLSDWLPRLCYFAVSLWIATGIIHSFKAVSGAVAF